MFFTHNKSFLMNHQIYDLWPLHNGNVMMATANHLTTWDDSESWRCHLFTEYCALQWTGSLTLITFKLFSLPSTNSESSCLAQSSCPEPCSWVNVPTVSTVPCNINRDTLISMFRRSTENICWAISPCIFLLSMHFKMSSLLCTHFSPVLATSLPFLIFWPFLQS